MEPLMLACLPTDRQSMLELAKKVGLDPATIPTPTDLYSLRNCEDCDCSIWVGPRQMEVKNANTALLMLCYGCAAKRQAVADLEIRSLGGGSTVEGRPRW